MQPHSMTSAQFWRAYWITLRPYLFFVSGASGLVGLAMVPTMGNAVFAVAFAGFFFTYGLGQALTDVFQTDTDAISSPYRPLTQGAISGRQVLIVSLGGLGICSVGFVVFNPWNLGLCALGVVGLATYTPFKRRWWAGPFWNSWIVALLPVMGYMCGGAEPRAIGSEPALWAACASIFFSYAIFVLIGYFKDISADRATGYDTLPVRYGWGVSVGVSAAFAALAVGASVVLLRRTGVLAEPRALAAWVGLALWGLGVLGTALAHVLILRTRKEAETHLAIAFVVRGYVLLHLGEAVALRQELAGPALGFYALFELALATRPEQSQI